MQKMTSELMRSALAAVCSLMIAPSQAQDAMPPASDPARWYVDDSSAQAQLRTLRKEIGAAYQEAQAQCRRQPASERSACMKAARATYRADMANAEQLRANAPQ